MGFCRTATVGYLESDFHVITAGSIKSTYDLNWISTSNPVAVEALSW
jgi:hypothetical protein